MSTTRFDFPKAPATEPDPKGAGLLLCGHGVYGGPGIAAKHAAAIQRLGLFDETRVCCLKGRPSLPDVLRNMTTRRIFVVPLLMAEGYTARKLLQRALAADRDRLVICRPVGTHPRIAEVLSASALRCCRAEGWAPERTRLVVMGHGTRRYADSGGTAWRHAQAIAAGGIFAAVETAFLDQPPGLETVLARKAAPHSVVVGLFADRGAHGEGDVPALLAELGQPAAYAGPVGTAPELTRIILGQVFAREAKAA